MIFISAGHNSQATFRPDPGAIGVGGQKEGDLTIQFRDLVCQNLEKEGAAYIRDTDEESLKDYLARIKTGRASVVIEYHFDSSSNPLSSGTTSIVEEESESVDYEFGLEIATATAVFMHIRNRGVKPESYTFRKRLGLMREEGIICLCELGFISNVRDMEQYHMHKEALAAKHASILIKYEGYY